MNGMVRGVVAGVAATVAVALTASPALAGPGKGKKAKKDRVVDITADRDKLIVLRTDGGHFIVIEPFNISSDHFYFGDAKNLYRQRAISGGGEGKKRFSRRIWAPKVNNQAYVQFKDGAWTFTCGERKTPLSEADEKESEKVLGDGTYHLALWTRVAYALSRDDHGRYYYVDRLREGKGKGFRLFIGQKGALKKSRLTNIVSDSEGDIFATKKGELRLVMQGGDPGNVTWIRGKKKSELIVVPLWKNRTLIYDELGVYDGQLLGTPCDYY